MMENEFLLSFFFFSIPCLEGWSEIDRFYRFSQFFQTVLITPRQMFGLLADHLPPLGSSAGLKWTLILTATLEESMITPLEPSFGNSCD